MPVPSRLRVELLEARDTPTTFDLTHVLVTTTGPSLDSQWEAVLGGSPEVAGVSKIGDRLFRADLAAGVTVTAAVAALAGRPGVAAAQPDYQLVPAAAVTPNDPGYAAAWQYATTSAAAAWGVTTGTGGTIVAVLDTGVDVTHPDLAANIWHNPREVAGNGRDDDGNGYVDDATGWNFVDNNADVSDAAGHGTHAAGIIGAVGGNGVGVTGVDWHARIMPLKFMSGAAGGLTSDAVRAIDYAVANGARVISESWGGTPFDAALLAATQRARDAGVIVVSAAGNYATDTDSGPFYPAGYVAQSDNVVTVAASTPDDQLASFSNYGATTVTLAAPGQWITSTLPNGQYGEKSGTSMAAPFVAGAISLLWDAHPDWSYRQIIDRLKASVDVLPALAGKVATGGRIDLGKLLAPPPVSPPPAPVPVTPPTPTPAPAPTTPAAVVTDGIIGGPRIGAIDRAWVRFAAAVDPTAVAASVDFGTPLGTVHPSAVLPVAGSGNTQFTLMFARTYTEAGTYHLSIGAPAAAARFTLDMQLTGTPWVVAPIPLPPRVVVPPVTPPVVQAPVADRQSVAAAGLPTAVNPGRTTRVELYVPAAVTVQDVAVQISVQHARVSDLSIRLTAPDGSRYTLFNRRGGAGANLAGTLFSDAATLSLAAATAPFAGAVRPEQSLAALNGTSGRGLWVVELFDLGADVSGTLTAVTLSFASPTTQSVAWPATASPASVTPLSPPPPPAAKPTPVTTDAGRPDVVAVPPPAKPVPPRPADVTGWLVGRLRERL